MVGDHAGDEVLIGIPGHGPVHVLHHLRIRVFEGLVGGAGARWDAGGWHGRHCVRGLGVRDAGQRHGQNNGGQNNAGQRSHFWDVS